MSTSSLGSGRETAASTRASIVVGVDGSRAATVAAHWALEEAVSRGLPLHLLAAAETPTDRAAAKAAVHAVATAFKSTGRPVDLTVDVVAGAPGPTLLTASRTAAMICVGAVGLSNVDHHPVGSTANALVAAAQCPVAIIRNSRLSTDAGPGWIVVELDGTPQGAAVLQAGVEEARLRAAPLRVHGSWQSRFTDIHDSHAVADGNRMMRAQLDRRLSQWKHRYPDLDARPVAVHGSMLNYLTKNAESIQLVVVGARDTANVGDLLGATGLAVLNDTNCSVLVLDRQLLL